MQPGYEFVDGKPVLRPDYDYERILGFAGPPDEHGIRVVNHLTIPAGATAWNPGSTKHVIHGPAVMKYEIRPDGVTATILEGGE